MFSHSQETILHFQKRVRKRKRKNTGGDGDGGGRGGDAPHLRSLAPASLDEPGRLAAPRRGHGAVRETERGRPGRGERAHRGTPPPARAGSERRVVTREKNAIDPRRRRRLRKHWTATTCAPRVGRAAKKRSSRFKSDLQTAARRARASRRTRPMNDTRAALARLKASRSRRREPSEAADARCARGRGPRVSAVVVPWGPGATTHVARRGRLGRRRERRDCLLRFVTSGIICRWPDELIGRNSVIPCIVDKMIK